jgi:hypothetical protein
VYSIVFAIGDISRRMKGSAELSDLEIGEAVVH